MINSTGYLRKIRALFFSCVLVFTISLFFVGVIYAAPKDDVKIATSISIKYLLSDQKLTAEYSILMTSNSSYPTVINYNNLLLPFKDISDITITSASGSYTVSTTPQSENTELLLDYKGDIIKNDRPLSTTIVFSVNSLVSGIDGHLNKLILPVKFAKDVQISELDIKFQTSIGGLQYISERPEKTSSNLSLTSVLFTNPTFEYISLVIGPVISYDFEISQELSNDSDIPLNFDISLPRPQFNQSITFSKILPSPSYAFADKDTNIYLRYTLEPKQKINLDISGNVAIMKKYESVVPTTKELSNLTQKTGYWEITDQNELRRFELYLKKNLVEFDNSSRPIVSEKLVKYAYQYVIDRLTIRSLTSDVNDGFLRGGANVALQRKTESSAEDYADLLIALLREYNVPSEMVIGYVTPVNTSNTGYFHTWVQFWIKDQGWRALDPALDDLSEKELYNSEYFDHIAILVRETNPISPKMPSTAPDDYLFKLAIATPDLNNNTETNASIDQVLNFKTNTKGNLRVTNSGNSLIKSYDLIDSKVMKSSLNQEELIVPGQSINIPINYTLQDSDRFSQNVDLSGKILFKNTSLQNFQSVYNLSLSVQKVWWWDPLVIIIGISMVSLVFTLIWFILSKSNIMEKMNKPKISKTVTTLSLIVFSFFMLSEATYAQSIVLPNPDSQTTVEAQTTVVKKKNVDFTIELEVGTQSVWDNSVVITAKFLPTDDVSETQVSWDVPQGLQYSENYTNYFPVTKDQVYTATATFYPINSGTYDIAVDITAWNVASNTASSKKVTITFDKNLIVSPAQAGYQTGLLVRYGVLAIVGIVLLLLLVFLAKKGMKRFTLWFMPQDN